MLVDTSPDMREQLLDAHVGRLDAVLITHDHADQLHGMDDLRAITMNAQSASMSGADRLTWTSVMGKFGYCFDPAARQRLSAHPQRA